MARRTTWHRAWVSFAWITASLGATLAGGTGTATQATERMSRARTEEIARDYLAALLSGGPFAQYLANDAVMTLVDVGHEVHGREAMEQAFNDFHQVAFAAKPEMRSFTAGPGVAVAELVFVGTHTGDFFGIPATGRDVRVPYVAVYDVQGDRITALRLYGPASGLVQQITADETA